MDHDSISNWGRSKLGSTDFRTGFFGWGVADKGGNWTGERSVEGSGGQEEKEKEGEFHRRRVTVVSRRKHGRGGPNGSALGSVSERI